MGPIRPYVGLSKERRPNMTRHIGDKTRESGQGRLREYLRQEREAQLHPAIRALISRPKPQAGATRQLREFARIERGRLA